MDFSDAKTNWLPTDYYSHNDLNRVESLIELLRPKVESYSEKTIILQAIVTNRTVQSIEFADSLYRIERNISILGDELGHPEGYETPKLGWSYNSPFSYEDANRLEKNLVALNRFVASRLNPWYFCGQYTCGEEGVI